jgi:hypothetical protein
MGTQVAVKELLTFQDKAKDKARDKVSRQRRAAAAAAAAAETQGTRLDELHGTGSMDCESDTERYPAPPACVA